MLRFYADKFVTCLNMLHAIEVAILQTRRSTALDSHVVTVKAQISDFIKQLDVLKLPLTRRAALELFQAIDNPQRDTHSQNMLLLARIQKMTERLRDELEANLFIYVDRRELFEQPSPLFGDLVSKRFPSAAPEIEEAGKCLALRRPTASVMHLMRVLEVGLHSLANVIQVSFANPNWHALIDQIESKIKAMNSMTQVPNWKADQQFYSEAAAHFRLLKDAWRNHSMHIKERYSEERAEAIFQSVRSFMQQLATKLSEVP